VPVGCALELVPEGPRLEELVATELVGDGLVTWLVELYLTVELLGVGDGDEDTDGARHVE
jgi:hypothetical protein